MTANKPPVTKKFSPSRQDTWTLRINWGIAVMIALAVLLSALHHTFIAICCISVTAFALGMMRAVLQDRSPWIVRSVTFDVIINIGLAVGLIVIYISVMMLVRGH